LLLGLYQSGGPGFEKDDFPAPPPGGAYGPGSSYGQQLGPGGRGDAGQGGPSLGGQKASGGRGERQLT